MPLVEIARAKTNFADQGDVAAGIDGALRGAADRPMVLKLGERGLGKDELAGMTHAHLPSVDVEVVASSLAAFMMAMLRAAQLRVEGLP